MLSTCFRASCLPESFRRALVDDARGDSPVSDASLSASEKRDAFLSPSRFSTYKTHSTRRPGDLMLCSLTKLIGPKLRSKLFGGFTLVRVVLHGLRRSPFASHRLGGEAARSGGICHLLREYTVARPSRSQS